MAKYFRKMIIVALAAVLCMITLCAPMAMAETYDGLNLPFLDEAIFEDDAFDSRFRSFGSLEEKHANSEAAENELVIILDEEVPLAEAPATGDASAVWALMSFVSVGGMVFASTKRRK